MNAVCGLLENKVVGFINDSTLIAVIRNAEDKPRVEASINRDLKVIHRWCADWNMKLNLVKTKSLNYC